MGVEYNQKELKRVRYFKREEVVTRHLERIGSEIVAAAQSLAPRETGAGAASIHYELVTDPETGERSVNVGWDRKFFYMWFHEAGTRGRQRNGRGIQPHPFLRPAAQRFLA